MGSVKTFDPSLEKIIDQKETLSIFPVRDDEPEYAKLNDNNCSETNRYGNAIPLVDLENSQSLNINGVDAIGNNPNRNKQHAFHFTADNCIGCHACESACSEKNDLPAHLSFRSVGYVEGGTYPNFTRMNISMACNHCDDPVCLKGCPTRAYTKHPEYGAVIQDPDICFGCGYCTWVCPYNAPQLDPVAGQVEKCNMCVDRLEVGLKPACVSACVGNALEFGVVENVPDNRESIDTRIPGFPDPEISKPNIRFQQQHNLPQEMKRTDSMPVKYRKDDAGNFLPVIDKKQGNEQFWNIKKLSSRENPLVIFTLVTQAAVGAFIFSFLAAETFLPELTHSILYAPLMVVILGLVSLGLFMSTIHLGKPLRFYRGFNNLKHSPVSREGLGVVIFMAMTGCHFLLVLPQNPWIQSTLPLNPSLQANLGTLATICGVMAIPAGLTALYYMYRCYCIKARPFWNHIQTACSFFGNMFYLGAIVSGAFIVINHLLEASSGLPQSLTIFSGLMAAGLLIEGIGLLIHHRDLSGAEHEGAASHYVQRTTFGKTWILRNTILALSLIAAIGLALTAPDSATGLTLWAGLALIITVTSVASRALFYVLVIPTTMPGAFFWKNPAFEEHARETGLADLPQTGVVPNHH